MQIVDKIGQHLKRKRNAAFFNIPFRRRSEFCVPHHLNLGNRNVLVASMDERGCTNDFLTCFIEDEYGLMEVSHPVDVVLDIGANVGFFSMAARGVFPNATIHAYEPNPRVIDVLRRNANEALFNVFEEAVGSENGEIAIWDEGDSNQARCVEGADIKMISIADVIDRFDNEVDFAKIDCEGAEWELLECSDALRYIKRIRMEFHLWAGDGHTVQELKDVLAKAYFQVERLSCSGQWGTVWAVRQ